VKHKKNYQLKDVICYFSAGQYTYILIKCLVHTSFSLRYEKDEVLKMNQELERDITREKKQRDKLQSEIIKLQFDVQQFSTKLKQSEEEKEYWINR